MRIFRIRGQSLTALVMTLLAAILLTACSHRESSCSTSSVEHVVRQLLVGTSGADSAKLDDFLEISAAREISSSTTVSQCEADFSVSKSTIADLEKQIPNIQQDVRAAALQARMSSETISSGILSGIVDYAVERATDEDGTVTTHVTLSNFNVARSFVLSKYLGVTALLSSVSNFEIPASLTWDAKANGDPKLLRGGHLAITLSSKKGAGNDIPTPLIHVEGYGASIDQLGEPGFENPTARLVIGQLDLSGSSNQVAFLTYSGGAHCCTSIKILDLRAGKWTVLDMGMWDGEPLMEFPKDIDGDHIPDIVLNDGAFNYTFASYADSYAPPLIFNVVNGAIVNVSAESRYAAFYRDRMTEYQAVCLLHDNGACAAFVGAASRIGDYSYAFQFLLDNYDKSGTWNLPKLCHVALVSNQCPSGQDYDAPNYPMAVAAFLAQNGYPVPTDGAPQTIFAPTFDCSKVKSQVLILVCATPSLAMQDQELAASYLAAKAVTKDATGLRTAEIAWIKLRNNSASDPDALAAQYKARIDELEQYARANTGSGQQQ